MKSQPQVLVVENEFRFENGVILPGIEIAYHTYGSLSPERDNAVWIYHALTGNSDPVAWWPDVIGEGKAIDPAEHFIVCANMLGSCYGSSGPLATNPGTGDFWYSRFPDVTIRDSVRAFALLRKHLGIEKIKLAIGPSLGGQQCLEAGIEEPHIFERLVLIATNAQHSAWGIAWNASQRMAVEADPTWLDDSARAGRAGLAAARAIAMLSYRSSATYNSTQLEPTNDKRTGFLADSYQRYQGEKLTRRFHAHSLLLLSKAMDSHNVGRNRKSIEHALERITATTLVVGISSDILFPVHEQKFLASRIPNARYREIDSLYGHDGFLIEGETIATIIKEELKRTTHRTRAQAQEKPQQQTKHQLKEYHYA